jgi:hypothetical protein
MQAKRAFFGNLALGRQSAETEQAMNRPTCIRLCCRIRLDPVLAQESFEANELRGFWGLPSSLLFRSCCRLA